MALTRQEVLDFRAKAIAAGKDPAAVDEYLRSKGYSVSGSATERLLSQFSGTRAMRATTPSPVVQDPGVSGMLGASLERNVLGPFAGIAERMNLAPEGTFADIEQRFEDTRLDYLSQDPGALRTTIAGLSEAASMALPLTPGKALGRLGAGVATKAGAGALGSRLAAGALAGAAEGAVVGIGETVGLEPMDQLKRGALMTVAGGLFGAGGALSDAGASKGILKDADPVTGEFLRRYVADDTSRAGVLSRVGDAVNSARAHWIDEHAPYIDTPKRLLEEAVRSGAPAAEIAKLQRDFTEAVLKADAAKVSDAVSLYPVEKTTIDPITTEATGEGLVPILTELQPAELSDMIALGLSKRNVELAARSTAAKESVAAAKARLKSAKDALKEFNFDRHAELYSGAEARQVRSELRRQIEEAEGVLARDMKDADIVVTPESLEDAYSLINHVEQKYAGRTDVDLNRSLERFRDWSVRAMIDPLEKVGVFSRQEVEDMLSSNEWYMPFIRAAEYVEGRQLEYGLGAPKKGKRIHGGLSEEVLMKNPLESAAEMAVRVQSFARKQAVRNHLGEMADRYADKIGDEIRPASSQHVGDTFRVWRNGELVNYAADKELVRAVEALNLKEANLITDAAMQINNLFRASATLSPQFSFRNLFKDWFTFSTMSQHTNFGPLSIARAVASELFHRIGPEGRPSDLWKEFELSAGFHGTFLSADRTGKDIERAVKLSRDLSSGSRGFKEFKRNPLAPLQALGQAIERMPRWTEYRAARKYAGKSAREAGWAAGEATLPFHRAGSIGKRYNRVEAFFNAQMQDLSKFYRSMRDKPFSTATKGMAWMTAPSLYFWAKNANDPEYQSLPEWEKVLFLHTHKMENGKYFRVPMPPGILGLVFSYIPRKMADHFYGKDPKALEKILEESWEQTPLQYFPAPGLNSVQDAFIRMMPTAIQPIAEIINNRNPFFDRPVISERLLGVDASEQKTPYTTNLARWMAKPAQSLPYAKETMLASPVAVDYLLAGYGASLGRMGARLTGQEAPTRRMGVVESLGLQSTSPVGFSSQPVQDLYDLSEMIQKSRNTLRRQSTVKMQKDYLSLHPEAAYLSQMNKVKEGLKGYSQARESIMSNSRIGAVEREQKLLELDQEITMFAAAMLGEFSKAIERDKQIDTRNRAEEN